MPSQFRPIVSLLKYVEQANSDEKIPLSLLVLVNKSLKPVSIHFQISFATEELQSSNQTRLIQVE